MLRNLISIRHYVRKSGIPGLNKLSKELKDVDDIFEDPEGFGDIESDFMEVGKSHKQHKREMQERRNQIRHLIVGNKYIKSTKPNFLTYAEKEQIRLLHARDTEEWNPERLSESFPATPDVILQILKAKWTPENSQRIKRHDRSVLENWQKFNENKFAELDPALVEHLRKFAARKPEDLKNLTSTFKPKAELPKPQRTEFLSIITESMKFRKSQHMIEAPTEKFEHCVHEETTNGNKPSEFHPQPANSNQSSMEEETYLIDKIENKKPMRFRDLVRQNPEIQQDQSEVAAHRMENPQGTGVLSSASYTPEKVNKFVTNEVELSSRDMISMSSGIRQKIHIPKKLWKKGYTYRLSDCYYTDDGEFLYRVPGMTGRNVK